MLAISVTLVLINVALPAFTAPTTKPDVVEASNIVNELKKIQLQLDPLNQEFQKIVEAIEKQTQENSEKHENHKEKSEESKQAEKSEGDDDFILRVAQKVTSKLSVNDPPKKIDSLVNSTAYHLAAKMNASRDHFYEFRSKLKAEVLKLLNEQAETYEPPVNKSLPAAPSGVDQSKVMQALEELLEGPLISGFVSQEQERQMIRSAITALSKDFGISKLTTEDLIQTMIKHVQQDVKSFSVKSNESQNKTAQAMTDDEKILGLEKMVEDKVTENNLNLNEMKYLVEGLAAAVGVRNKLSEEKTKSLEEQMSKGVHEFFAKSKLPGNEQSEISQLMYDKNVPEGFRERQEDSNKDEEKRSFVIEKRENEKRDEKDVNLTALLEDLEKKWNEEKQSSIDAKKQKQYLKEILSNSLALMESLNTEKKKQSNTELKPRTEGNEHSFTEKSKHIEPTKQATQKPTNTESKHVRHTTEQLNVKSQAVSTKAVEKKNTPRKKSEPTPKKGGISDDMEKEIEEAEAEIQLELEVAEREDEKKRKKLHETNNEEENKKEENKKKETKEKSEQISQEEIDANEKEIEKELEDQAKALESSKATTAKPETTKENDENNELIRQLDDLFQDS